MDLALFTGAVFEDYFVCKYLYMYVSKCGYIGMG